MGEKRHLLIDDALLSNVSGGLRFETSRPLSLTDEPVVAPDAPWERGCWISCSLASRSRIMKTLIMSSLAALSISSALLA